MLRMIRTHRILRNRITWLARTALVAIIALMTLLAAVASAGAAPAPAGPRAVYTTTNAASGNQVVVFARAADGALTKVKAVDTGGLGIGASLGSQGALSLTQDGRWLLAVNAGSDSISVFSVDSTLGGFGRGFAGRDGDLPNLTLVGTTPSGGDMPISLTVSGDLVYVLNAGGADASGNITGFYLTVTGALRMIPDSTQAIAFSAMPAQVSFSSAGAVLLVTEKATNDLVSYTVDAAGRAGSPHVVASNGATPFGFAFDNHNRAFVSEAGPGAVSSYQVGDNGSLATLTASAMTHQVAACWVVVTNNGKFVYTANAHSSSISGFRVAPDGSLTLLNADGITASTGSGSAPLDMALSVNSRYLYVLSAANGTIGAYQVQADGSLTPLSGVTDASLNGAVGLAAQ